MVIRSSGGMIMQGLPANVNPFCVVDDHCICDGALQDQFEAYFGETRKSDPSRCPCVALESVIRAPLSQKEAEDLVRRVRKEDAIGDVVAIKEEYRHIIPYDLRGLMPVARTKAGSCSGQEIYFIDSTP